MSLFRAHILPGGLGRYHTLVAAHLLSSLSARCWLIRLVPRPNFVLAPFPPTPHLLPFFSSQTWGQPVRSLPPCAWVVLAREGSVARLRPWLCPSGQRLCAARCCREVWLGTSSPSPSPSMDSEESNPFPSNIFPSCCQTHPERANESALLRRLPALRSKARVLPQNDSSALVEDCPSPVYLLV